MHGQSREPRSASERSAGEAGCPALGRHARGERREDIRDGRRGQDETEQSAKACHRVETAVEAEDVSTQVPLQMIGPHAVAGAARLGLQVRDDAMDLPHIVEWRRSREAGAIAALKPRTRSSRRSPQQIELECVRRRAERAEAELAQARLALSYQPPIDRHGAVS
jgi:hypothetical protein